MSISSCSANRVRGFVVTLLIGAFVFAFVLADSPQLHARVHPDAARSDHTCAVTLLASGSFDDAAPPPVLPPGPQSVCSDPVLLAPVWVQSVFLQAHLFAHAPPAFS